MFSQSYFNPKLHYANYYIHKKFAIYSKHYMQTMHSELPMCTHYLKSASCWCACQMRE